MLHCDAFEVFLHGKDLDAPMRAGFAAETAERDGTRAGPPMKTAVRMRRAAVPW
ncbi:hypothetical protein [Myxococcus sp. NMCA1]|uniref:hypothetical protein n=1 Tax=Myxococcus sp. NMCA1 TaxID=2996785 RepID=UPI0022856BFD|nr:hypothetical protein [Myxococcus sp. NMCA1]WAM25045.1 hypothetical protein OZ403_31625 [Myxococcus sp. NMCA1]